MASTEGLASTGGLAGEGVTSAEPSEYALIRVVPRVERGEAINAGVILYCQQHRYLGCRILLNEDRLRALDPGTDLAAVAAALGALEEGCRSGPAAGQPPGVRFRWLTATRSTIVQPGPGAQRPDHRPGRRTGPALQRPGPLTGNRRMAGR